MVAPREAGDAYLPPQLEAENGPPRFCASCGQRFWIAIINVQVGDEDCALIEELTGMKKESIHEFAQPSPSTRTQRPKF